MQERIRRRLAGTREAPPPHELAAYPGDLNVPLERLPIAPEKLLPAAVLVPLVERAAGLQVLLTQRTDHLRQHAGQQGPGKKHRCNQVNMHQQLDAFIVLIFKGGKAHDTGKVNQQINTTKLLTCLTGNLFTSLT